MSAMMMKMAADFLGISAEEITATFERLQTIAVNGVAQIEEMNARLGRIEQALEIEGTGNAAVETAGTENA